MDSESSDEEQRALSSVISSSSGACPPVISLLKNCESDMRLLNLPSSQIMTSGRRCAIWLVVSLHSRFEIEIGVKHLVGVGLIRTVAITVLDKHMILSDFSGTDMFYFFFRSNFVCERDETK